MLLGCEVWIAATLFTVLSLGYLCFSSLGYESECCFYRSYMCFEETYVCISVAFISL